MADIDWELITKICKFTSVVSGGLLAGCGFYVLAVEHPARMQHKENTALDNWSKFYNKAFSAMSVTSICSIVTGAAAYFASRSTPQEDPYLLLGPGIICLNIPYSALAMLPLNNAMLDAQKEGEKDEKWISTNLNRWARLHVVRAIFSNTGFMLMVSRLVS